MLTMMHPVSGNSDYLTFAPEVPMGNQSILSLILKVVALAMGVAVVVLGILGTATPTTLITLLGIGLFCLALWALQKDEGR